MSAFIKTPEPLSANAKLFPRSVAVILIALLASVLIQPGSALAVSEHGGEPSRFASPQIVEGESDSRVVEAPSSAFPVSEDAAILRDAGAQFIGDGSASPGAVDPADGASLTQKITLDLNAHQSNYTTDPLTYPSDEQIKVSAQLHLSGSETILRNPVLIFSVPANDHFGFPLNAPSPPVLTGAQCEQNFNSIKNDPALPLHPSFYPLHKEYSWKCSWDLLRGTTTLGNDFSFKFQNTFTPNGHQAPVRLSLSYDGAHGQPERLEKEIILTALAEKYGRIQLSPVKPYSTLTTTNPGDTATWLTPTSIDQEITTHTPADGVLTHHIASVSELSRYSPQSSLGRLKFDHVRLRIQLPPEAEYAGGLYPLYGETQIKTDIWDYDPTSHSVTYVGTKEYKQPNTDRCNGSPCYPYLSLRWKKTPLWQEGGTSQQKFYPLISSMVIDPDTPSEVVVVEKDVDYVGFSTIPLPKPLTVNPAVKESLGPRTGYLIQQGQIDGTPIEEVDLNWGIDVFNYNNFSSIPPLAAGSAARAMRLESITEIRDSGLGEDHYYQKVSLKEADLFPRVYKTFSGVPNRSGSVFNADNSTVKAKFLEAKPYLVGIQGSGADEQTTVIARDLRVGDEVIIADTGKRYTAIALRFEEELQLDNELIRFHVSTRMTAKMVAQWKDPHFAESYPYDKPYKYPNSSKTTWRLHDGTIRTWPAQAEHKIGSRSFPVGIRVTKEKTVNYGSCSPNLTENSTVDCSRAVQLSAQFDTPSIAWKEYGEQPFRFTVAAVLPPGVNPISGGRFISSTTGRSSGRIIQNFNDTGKTAIVFEEASFKGAGQQNPVATAFIYLELTQHVDPGLNIVEWLVYWDDTEVYGQPGNRGSYRSEYNGGVAVKDPWDLDKDGVLDEKFLKAETHLRMNFGHEAYATTFVGSGTSTLPDGFATSGLDLGSELSYRMRFVNTSPNSEISQLALLMMLPYPGKDRTVVDNQDGIYLPRQWQLQRDDGSVEDRVHSAFFTPLTGPLDELPANREVADRFDFYYLLKSDYDAITQYSTANLVAARWVSKSEVTDWSQVIAVRAVMKEGEVIPALTKTTAQSGANSVNIVLHSTIPFDESTKTLEHGSRAVASVSASIDGESSYLEANAVYPEIAIYRVEGLVFLDRNRNGYHDTDKEAVLPGYQVRLYDAQTCTPTADGTLLPENCVAQNPTNEGQVLPEFIAVTKSDEQGRYNFKVFRRGDYFVGFQLQGEGLFFTDPGGTDLGVDPQLGAPNHVSITAPVANQGAGSAGYTTGFSLRPTNRLGVRNAGVTGIFPNLPATGGPGVVGFLAIGLALVGISGLWSRRTQVNPILR